MLGHFFISVLAWFPEALSDPKVVISPFLKD